MSEHIASLTPTKAMNPSMPQLSRLRRDDENLYKKAMGLAIIRMTEILNATNTLSTEQITELITKISHTYYFYRFEEVLYVLEKGAYGSYGKDFNKLDGSLVMGWFERYDVHERTDQAIAIYQADVAVKSQPEQPMNDDELRDYYQRVGVKVENPFTDTSHLRQKDRESEQEKAFQQFRTNYLKRQRENQSDETPDV